MDHQEENLNLTQIFLKRVSRYQGRKALGFKKAGEYTYWSWDEWAKHIRDLSYGLYSLGVRLQDRVGILSENCPQWTVVDFASLSLGAAVVPIYPTSSCQDVSHILENAGVEVLFISTFEQMDRIREVLPQINGLRFIVVMNGNPARHCEPAGRSNPDGDTEIASYLSSLKKKLKTSTALASNNKINESQASPQKNRGLLATTQKIMSEKIIFLEDIYERGRLEGLNDPGLYQQWVENVTPDNLATIIYTSGTTGAPKGVMLTHRNFVANYLGASERIEVYEDDVALSFLPLCHVFERLAGYYFMVFHGATIAYAENMQTVPDDMRLVRPTIAAAVPRFYEKMYARILEGVEAASPLQRRIFFWALKVGQKRVSLAAQKKKDPGLEIAYLFAKALVFKKVKNRLGGRLRFFISGGAPLSKELAEFFFAADVFILEGYGLSETSPVISVNSPLHFKFGTVGQPLSNAKVKLAEDGEILTQGPCVMKGYYQNPEATKEVMQDGWFHTGDIGEIDAEGFLKITDRKKDIIATSGGKKVSPQNIENGIMTDKLFSQVVLIGDKRNYLVALIVPNRKEIEEYAPQAGIGALSWEAILKHPCIYQHVEERLSEKNKHLATYEQIKYFALLPKEFSQDSGELTPTLKVRRRFVAEKYKDIIEELYCRGAKATVTDIVR